ncbi:MAG: recombinase family protein [Flavonifractor sp.]|jgi:site-specific DNA recombinase|nr:recombinase family protein [Flavonifractor sp.]
MPFNDRGEQGTPSQSEDGGKVFIPAKPKAHFDDPAQIFRVCAYCRVSTGSEEQLSSFELQQAHYRQLAKERPNWELKHVYADEGISGTSLKNRAEFNAMIAACERGEYDLVVTKSVSRFARNLVDCISLIRKLKNLSPPVGVFFETDHLNTLGKDSELMLTFLASIAQEESIKKREAMVWSLAQRFKDRKLLTPPPLGYDRQRDSAGNYIKYAPLVVNEAEAKVVRFIFNAYLHGWSQTDIADFLTDIGCRTKTGSTNWNSSSVGYILTNERYCGDVLTWKTFTSDLFEHKRRKNRQDLDQYHYMGQHEAIISRETFEMAQTLIQNRKHHICGGLPSLQVIDGGVFRGFVPINHHWVNDDPGLYYDASNSVKAPERKTRMQKNVFSAFNLEGYQVVRSQFLQTRYEGPAMTISRERITFNLFCMRQFADIGYIQLLLHPSERKIAIRPCGRDAAHSVKWRSDATKLLYPKALCCRHFGAALFHIMEWDPDLLYRVQGTWIRRGDGQIILFNLESAVSVLLAPTEEARKKRIELFPEQWEHGFGEEFYDHIVENEIFYMAKSAVWQANRPSVPAPGVAQYSVPTEENLQAMMETLTREVTASHAGT